MNPHYRYNTPDTYLGWHCQEEIEKLFKKLNSERPCDYDKYGIQAYHVAFGTKDEVLTVLHDTREDKAVRGVYPPALDKEPDTISAFAMKRASAEAGAYHLLSSRSSYESLVAGAKAIDADIGDDMLGYLRGAFSMESDLRKHAASIEKLGPVVRAWAAANNQYLSYTGENQRGAKHALKNFIASYLQAFIMDDVLVLTHSGAAKTFVMRTEEAGNAWYCCDTSYGVKKEKGEGRLVDEEYDDLSEKNAYEHYVLKHVFVYENSIAKDCDGDFLPVSDHVEELQLLLKCIVEDVMHVPGLKSLADSFEEQAELFGAMLTQKASTSCTSGLPNDMTTDTLSSPQ